MGAIRTCAEAATASAVTTSQNRQQADAPAAQLEPADLTSAQRDPASLARLIDAGRVKPLGRGLDACRAGDLSALRQLVEGEGWDPVRSSPIYSTETY